MSDNLKNGQMMPAELTAQIREKYYFVEEDPFTKTKRLFFDNSGGSFRLKAASEAFQKVDDLPNCGGHGGAASNYLDSLRDQACKDISTMFNAEDGCITTAMTASMIVFDVSEVIIANVPGTNVVTTQLEHPSAFDGSAIPAQKFIAVREDNEAAELTGIDVTAYKIKAFVLSAVYCGIAGCLYAMMIKYVSPDTFTNNISSVILWTAIVGGFGTVVGPVLGGIIMQVLPEALRFLGDWRLVIYGVILLIVILRFPGGLYPYIQKFVENQKAKKAAGAAGKG